MRICICGAGTMGSGIAQVSAAAGFDTVLYDLNSEVVAKAKSRLGKDLDKLVEKQKISKEGKDGILQKIRFSSQINDCTADIIIEAVVEKMEVKVSLFRKLGELNAPSTLFASNTSSLSVSAIANELPHPGRVAGLHFFNPAPLMKLVEVVRGEKTEHATIEQLLSFTRKLGKTPVVCKDAPGFIVNRVARPYYIESLRMAEEGMDLSTIDRILEDRGFRMGPFKLMDLIGNDVNYAVSCSVYDQLGRPERLKPSPIQKEKVDSGALGKKSGKGYYQY
jgi:3-hydroxybutyryl-CoA dehydrogenase